MKWLRGSCVFMVCTISAVLWGLHLLNSPLIDKERSLQQRYLRAVYRKLAPDLKEQRLLAQDYWLRYPDVKNDSFWGEKSRLGIQGPADHYRQHGRREGRIYARVARPDDMGVEQKLARAYWKRYPDVAKSSLWGENSSLGILGPRDHYRFYGQRQGRRWGE